MSWSPKRTLAETDALLCAPGALHELELRVVDGKRHAENTYIVFGDQRWSFRRVREQSLKVAAIFLDVYGIRKGDRVAICSRNYPEYLVAFWACHLVGAVSVLANAWLPLEPLKHCFIHTQCKLIILDTDCANRLHSLVPEFPPFKNDAPRFIVISHDKWNGWKGMKSWNSLIDSYEKDGQDIESTDPGITPEDNSIVFFTSGTTGLPKGVLSTQRQFLTNIFNVLVGSRRALLRRGENISPLESGAVNSILISVPLFHVTGLTSLAMLATMAGMKIVLMRKWTAREGARLIHEENITIAGGVPTMVADLIESDIPSHSLGALMFGGAPPPSFLPGRARIAFPNATMSQGYGLTETNSTAVTISGDDYIARPTSCGLPAPVNDVLIMKDNAAVPVGSVGEVWLRGANVMKCYWGDEVATRKVLTEDGWIKTGDLGLLDEEGFLYIRDRIKDIIIRGGENIDSVTVENALYTDDRITEAAAVGVPDKRLGELVAAVVCVKPEYEGKVTEACLIELVRKKLPTYAVPVMILIQTEEFARTPSGKTLKTKLRTMASRIWLERAMNLGAKL